MVHYILFFQIQLIFSFKACVIIATNPAIVAVAAPESGTEEAVAVGDNSVACIVAVVVVVEPGIDRQVSVSSRAH